MAALGMLSLAVETANSFTSAYASFKELQESAKIIVAVSNYCKWPLRVISIEVMKGQTDSTMASVSPNSKGGWTASGEDSLVSYGVTEGYTVWTMDPDSFCVIYWKVGESEPNVLAVGCRPSEGMTVDDWERTIQKVKAGPSSHRNLYLQYHTYDTSQRSIQFCNDDICVQGILFSASEGKAKIEIFPLNATNVAPSLQDKLTQDLLDSSTSEIGKFGNSEKRERDSTAEISVGVGVGAFVAGIALVIIFIRVRDYIKRRRA